MAFRADLTVQKTLLPKPIVFTWQAAGVNVDLTGCSAKLMAKPAAGGAALATLTSAGGGGITLGGLAGTISLQFTLAHIAALVDQCRFDLVITYPGGSQEVLIEGVITVKPAPVTDIP
jgi:hypothetical protein